MKTLAKQGIINSIIIYLGFGIGYLNVGILLPLFFTAEEIGTKETIMAYALVLLNIGICGNSSILIKFFPKYSLLKKHGLLGLSLTVSSITFIIIASLFSFTEGFLRDQLSNAPLFNEYFKYILPISFLLVVITIFDAYLRSISLAHISVFFREFLVRIITSLIIIGYGLTLYDFDGFMIGFTIAHFLVCICYFLYIVIKTNHKIIFPARVLKLIDIKQIINFAGYGFATGLAGILILQIDKVMITNLISEKETAIYALSIYIATIIEAPRRALLQSASPLISKAWEENDQIRLKSIFIKSSINLQLIGSFLFLIILCSIEDIYFIIPKHSVYSQGKDVVFFIGLSKLIMMTFGVNNEVLSFSPKYKYNLYLALGLAILTIILNYVFIPILGINGAAIASLITVLTMYLTKQYIIQKEFHLIQFTERTIFLAVLTAVLYLIVTSVDISMDPYYRIFANCIVITITFTLAVYFLKISNEFNLLLRKLWWRKKN